MNLDKYINKIKNEHIRFIMLGAIPLCFVAFFIYTIYFILSLIDMLIYSPLCVQIVVGVLTFLIILYLIGKDIDKEL